MTRILRWAPPVLFALQGAALLIGIVLAWPLAMGIEGILAGALVYALRCRRKGEDVSERSAVEG